MEQPMSNPHPTSNDPRLTDPSSVEPPISPEESPERRSFGHKIILGSLAIFLFALAVPAMEVNIFSKTVFHGIHAAILVFLVALEKPLSVMPILALGNLWLLALPLVARSRRGSTVTIACLVTWGVAVSALSLSLDAKMADDLLLGYYAWVVAFFVAAAGATWVAFDRSDKQPWDQA
jgi:hypothetical protein